MTINCESKSEELPIYMFILIPKTTWNEHMRGTTREEQASKKITERRSNGMGM